MGRVCCFTFALSLTFIALASITVAIATNCWFNANHVFIEETPEPEMLPIVNGTEHVVNMTTGPVVYPCKIGLWTTCYLDKVPESINNGGMQISEKCVLDYNFPTHTIESVARSSQVSMVISFGIVLTSFVLGVVGMKLKKKNPLLLAGILLFVSALTTLVGMCCFIGRVLMQETPPSTGESPQNDQNIPENFLKNFDWSFYCGWGSLLVQMLAGSVVVCGVRGCLVSGEDPDKEDEFI